MCHSRRCWCRNDPWISRTMRLAPGPKAANRQFLRITPSLRTSRTQLRSMPRIPAWTVLRTFRRSVFLRLGRVCPARTALSAPISQGSTPSTYLGTPIYLCFWECRRVDFYRLFVFRRVCRRMVEFCPFPFHMLLFRTGHLCTLFSHARHLCTLFHGLECTELFTASRKQLLSGCVIPESPVYFKRRTKARGLRNPHLHVAVLSISGFIPRVIAQNVLIAQFDRNPGCNARHVRRGRGGEGSPTCLRRNFGQQTRPRDFLGSQPERENRFENTHGIDLHVRFANKRLDLGRSVVAAVVPSIRNDHDCFPRILCLLHLQ